MLYIVRYEHEHFAGIISVPSEGWTAMVSWSHDEGNEQNAAFPQDGRLSVGSARCQNPLQWAQSDLQAQNWHQTQNPASL